VQDRRSETRLDIEHNKYYIWNMNEKERRNLKGSAKVAEAERFVDAFTKKHGYPPTYREVADGLGLKSVSPAYNRLRNYRHKMIKKQT